MKIFRREPTRAYRLPTEYLQYNTAIVRTPCAQSVNRLGTLPDLLSSVNLSPCTLRLDANPLPHVKRTLFWICWYKSNILELKPMPPAHQGHHSSWRRDASSFFTRSISFPSLQGAAGGSFLEPHLDAKFPTPREIAKGLIQPLAIELHLKVQEWQQRVWD